MCILVPNINRRGQKDLSLKVSHKAYASRWGQTKHEISIVLKLNRWIND